jgi:hypothetical protein
MACGSNDDVEIRIEERITAWLSSKMKMCDKCVVCGSKPSSWTVVPSILLCPTSGGFGPTRFAGSVPFVVVVCPVCGYSMLFNAIAMGLVGTDGRVLV